MNLFLKHAKKKEIILRSIKVALVVGTMLALINHYESILNENLTSSNIFQIFLTYLVPFCVATYSSASHARHIEIEGKQLLK